MKKQLIGAAVASIIIIGAIAGGTIQMQNERTPINVLSTESRMKESETDWELKEAEISDNILKVIITVPDGVDIDVDDVDDDVVNASVEITNGAKVQFVEGVYSGGLNKNKILTITFDLDGMDPRDEEVTYEFSNLTFKISGIDDAITVIDETDKIELTITIPAISIFDFESVIFGGNNDDGYTLSYGFTTTDLDLKVDTLTLSGQKNEEPAALITILEIDGGKVDSDTGVYSETIDIPNATQDNIAENSKLFKNIFFTMGYTATDGIESLVAFDADGNQVHLLDVPPQKEGLSVGAIAGIVIGSLAVVGLIAGGGYYFYTTKKTNTTKK